MVLMKGAVSTVLSIELSIVTKLVEIYVKFRQQDDLNVGSTEIRTELEEQSM